MDGRERDAFMYAWARRRGEGAATYMALCAGIGALGGVAFAVLFHIGIGPTAELSDEAEPWIRQVAEAIGLFGLTLVMAVPSFAVLGVIVGDRAWRSLDARFRRLQEQGYAAPAEPPHLTLWERWSRWVFLAACLAPVVFVLMMVLRDA